MDQLVEVLLSDPNVDHFRLAKGELVQREGDQNLCAYYVCSGLLRSYVIDSKGKEHVYMFAPEGWLIGDIEAMEFEQPAQLYIDCLEQAEVIAINNDQLFGENISKDQMAASGHLLYRRIGRLQRRVSDVNGQPPSLTAISTFLKTYPDLPNRVPQHMIASFLGVMPQTLSTVRAKLARSSE